MKPERLDISKLQGMLKSRKEQTITIEEMNAAIQNKAQILYKTTKIEPDSN